MTEEDSQSKCLTCERCKYYKIINQGWGECSEAPLFRMFPALKEEPYGPMPHRNNELICSSFNFHDKELKCQELKE